MPRPNRRQDVVHAAALLFREKGYHATSLDDIAKSLGMLKGSVYHYIDSKEDLLLEVVSTPAEMLLERLRELVNQQLPPGEKIREVARAHASVLESYLPFVSVYVHEIAGRWEGSPWPDRDAEFVGLLETIIRDGLTDGSFSIAASPRVAALALIGALNWMTRWYNPDGPEDAQRLADEIATLLLRGLLARTTRDSYAEGDGARKRGRGRTVANEQRAVGGSGRDGSRRGEVSEASTAEEL